MIIDAHHHFWHFEPAEYGWINDQMPVLRRDFLPIDLLPELSLSGIDATVAVQARQSLTETEWLLKLASENPFVAGVVGWIPLGSSDVEQTLENVSQHEALKGVRHVVQDEPNEYFLSDDRFNAGVAALRRYGLAYDILIHDWQLPQVIEFVDRHPHQQFVLDHLAKPHVSTSALQTWAEQVRELAQRDNVMCKVSGLATEAAWKDWKEEQLRPYFQTVLEAFGPRRLMFGSDWPVCLLATTYSRWHTAVRRWGEDLSSDEQAWLFGKSAREAYRIHLNRD